jgi:hypothetical protein
LGRRDRTQRQRIRIRDLDRVAPLLLALTAPLKSFVAVVSVSTPAPALNMEFPPTVIPLAFCVIPTAFTVRLSAVLTCAEHDRIDVGHLDRVRTRCC